MDWGKRKKNQLYPRPSPSPSPRHRHPARSSFPLGRVLATAVAVAAAVVAIVLYPTGSERMMQRLLVKVRVVLALLLGVWTVLVAGGVNTTAPPPSPRSLKSDVTILINNDLQGETSPLSTSGVLLLSGRRTYAEASAGCQALGERLWAPETKTASIQPNLDYIQYYQGRSRNTTTSGVYWIASTLEGGEEDGTVVPRTIDASGAVSSGVYAGTARLQALCTQTAPYSTQNSQDTGPKWQVAVEANNQTLTGYRDHLSFRFLGIRYAPQPKRFTYSTPFQGSGEHVSALNFGNQCIQGSNTGSEDCLFLNIWTPYLPSPAPSFCSLLQKPLRSVGIWIHGGAFTGGTANDATFDGGNMASRGDMVLVAINYRLTTLGFLALKDGVTNGNYGLADQIAALDWVRAHIQNFGGDPDRITVFGQSAGAGSVRALMASPKAAGKFAAAIPLSNLGGLNYGTTYSRYYTIDQEMAVAGAAILNAANCTAAASQVDCLRAVPAFTLSSKLGTVARYLVVDGTYLVSSELELKTGPPLHVHIMMGITHDDGGPFIDYPKSTNQTEYLISSGFNPPPAELFPLAATTDNATLNLYNTTSRLATDAIFRCVDQATVYTGLQSGRFASVYYYEFDRSYQTTGWPGTDVCNPPKTADHPHGDPSKPYFKCHSGELYYVFGNLARQGLPMRDDRDLPFEQAVLDRFASFVRTYDPNPDEGFLRARGFETSLIGEGEGARWLPATKERGMTMRVLDTPSYQTGFRELEQCKGLGLGLESYYG
ncbi:Alpha/Beta hydrolase protein [Apodospora peruviana]|uniref:Alpha/Beta hydrolase protein n=1 Tax=Apodospora peruviana TaxID=516989 RepID=A0AAE0M7K8_9PEZI|nr:Alpha/Beta hydrolase protein [Apodospora peruviana]